MHVKDNETPYREKKITTVPLLESMILDDGNSFSSNEMTLTPATNIRPWQEGDSEESDDEVEKPTNAFRKDEIMTQSTIARLGIKKETDIFALAQLEDSILISLIKDAIGQGASPTYRISCMAAIRSYAQAHETNHLNALTTRKNQVTWLRANGVKDMIGSGGAMPNMVSMDPVECEMFLPVYPTVFIENLFDLKEETKSVSAILTIVLRVFTDSLPLIFSERLIESISLRVNQQAIDERNSRKEIHLSESICMMTFRTTLNRLSYAESKINLENNQSFPFDRIPLTFNFEAFSPALNFEVRNKRLLFKTSSAKASPWNIRCIFHQHKTPNGQQSEIMPRLFTQFNHVQILNTAADQLSYFDLHNLSTQVHFLTLRQWKKRSHPKTTKLQLVVVLARDPWNVLFRIFVPLFIINTFFITGPVVKNFHHNSMSCLALLTLALCLLAYGSGYVVLANTGIVLKWICTSTIMIMLSLLNLLFFINVIIWCGLGLLIQFVLLMDLIAQFHKRTKLKCIDKKIIDELSVYVNTNRRQLRKFQVDTYAFPVISYVKAQNSLTEQRPWFSFLDRWYGRSDEFSKSFTIDTYDDVRSQLIRGISTFRRGSRVLRFSDQNSIKIFEPYRDGESMC